MEMEHHQEIRAAALQAAATLAAAGHTGGPGSIEARTAALAGEFVPYIEKGVPPSDLDDPVDKTQP